MAGIRLFLQHARVERLGVLHLTADRAFRAVPWRCAGEFGDTPCRDHPGVPALSAQGLAWDALRVHELVVCGLGRCGGFGGAHPFALVAVLGCGTGRVFCCVLIGGFFIVRGRGKYRFDQHPQWFDDRGVSWLTTWKQRRAACD